MNEYNMSFTEEEISLMISCLERQIRDESNRSTISMKDVTKKLVRLDNYNNIYKKFKNEETKKESLK